MPNGKGSPDCHNCSYYRPIEKVNRCRKHGIFIPTISYEKICSDWQHKDTKTRKPFPGLKPGILYYYSYASNQVLEPLYPFDRLDRPITILTVAAGEDSEFGWVLYPRKGQYPRFPEPGGTLSIRVEDSVTTFASIDAQRLSPRHNVTNEGEVQSTWNTEDVRIIYCASSPDGLYLWLDRYIDVAACLKSYRKLFPISPKIYVLLEINPETGLYTLRPDIYWCGPYGRGTYRRGHYRMRVIKGFTGWMKLMLSTPEGRQTLRKVLPLMIRQGVKRKLERIRDRRRVKS